MILIRLVLLWCSLHIADGANQRRFMRDGCIECKRVTKLSYMETPSSESPLFDNFLFALNMYQEKHNGKLVSYRTSCLNTVLSPKISFQLKYFKANEPRHSKTREAQSKERIYSTYLFALSTKLWNQVLFSIGKMFKTSAASDICLQCSKVTQLVPIVSQASSMSEQFLGLVLGSQLRRNTMAGVCKIIAANPPRRSTESFDGANTIPNNLTYIPSISPTSREMMFLSSLNHSKSKEPIPTHGKSLKQDIKNWWKFFLLSSRGSCLLRQNKNYNNDKGLTGTSPGLLPQKNWLTTLYDTLFSGVWETQRKALLPSRINETWFLWFQNILLLQCDVPQYQSLPEIQGIEDIRDINLPPEVETKPFLKEFDLGKSRHIDKRWHTRFLNILKLKTPYKIELTNSLPTATDHRNREPAKVVVVNSSAQIDEDWYKWLLNSFKFRTPRRIISHTKFTFSNTKRKVLLTAGQVSYISLSNIFRLKSKNPYHTNLELKTVTRDHSIMSISQTKPVAYEIWYRWFSNIMSLQVCPNIRPKKLEIEYLSHSTPNIGSLPLKTKKSKNQPFIKSKLDKWKHRKYGGEVTDSLLLFLVFWSYLFFGWTNALSDFIRKSHPWEIFHEDNATNKILLPRNIADFELEWIVAIAEISSG